MDQLDRANIVLHLPQAFIPLNSLENFLKQLEIIISIFKKTGNLVPRGAGQLDSGFKASSWHSWGLSPGYVLLNTTVRRKQTKKNEYHSKEIAINDRKVQGNFIKWCLYQMRISLSWSSLIGKLQYWASEIAWDTFKHGFTSRTPSLSSFLIYSRRQVQATSSMSWGGGGAPWIIDMSFLTVNNMPCKWCMQAFK